MNPAPPKFTVLLPTHNRADVIGFAIGSVLGQTFSDFELLVVGDGCTDETARVVQSFGDPRIRWFELPKAPHFGYANRNLVLREARGELLAYMAHDDIWLADHLELMTPLFEANEIEWAYTRPIWMDNDGLLVPLAVDLRQEDQLAVFLNDHNTIPASNVVYRRRVHEWAGYWPEEMKMAGDWDLWGNILRPSNGANLAYLAEATQVHFRADWKKLAQWGPAPLQEWQALAASKWWPAALRVSVPAGVAAQAAVAQRLAERGPAGVAEIRAAVRLALDELAWREAADLAETRKELAITRQRMANVTERKEVAEGRVAEARSEASTARVTATAAVARADNADREAAAWRERARSRNRFLVALRRMQRRALLRVRPNPFFDRAWYRATNPDLDGADPYRHWRHAGAAERRNPSPGFSTAWYLEQNPDVVDSGLNPLDHYYVYGQLEGREAVPPTGGAGKQLLP